MVKAGSRQSTEKRGREPRSHSAVTSDWQHHWNYYCPCTPNPIGFLHCHMLADVFVCPSAQTLFFQKNYCHNQFGNADIQPSWLGKVCYTCCLPAHPAWLWRRRQSVWSEQPLCITPDEMWSCVVAEWFVSLREKGKHGGPRAWAHASPLRTWLPFAPFFLWRGRQD